MSSTQEVRPKRRIRGRNYGYAPHNGGFVLVPAGVYPTGNSLLEMILYFQFIDATFDDAIADRYDERALDPDVVDDFVQNEETDFEESYLPDEVEDSQADESSDTGADTEYTNGSDSSSSVHDYGGSDSGSSSDSGSDYGGGSDSGGGGFDSGGGGGGDF